MAGLLSKFREAPAPVAREPGAALLPRRHLSTPWLPPTPHSCFAALRILRGLPQIINGGRFLDKQGNRVRQPGERYAPNGVRLQLPPAPER